MTIKALFPELIYYDKVNIDNDKILDYCLLCKNTIPSRRISNVGGWQSNNIHDRDLLLTPLKDLSIYLKLIFLGVFENVGYKTSGKEVHLDAWININGHGHYNSKHVHQNSQLSGVYYVKVPEHSGNLKLYRNIDPTFSPFKCPDNIVHYDNPYTNEVCEIVAREKHLIIFPSHLPHSVDRNEMIDQDRISIAFNSVLF
jgi:uncharacterized protein (TIGR02466 family)